MTAAALPPTRRPDNPSHARLDTTASHQSPPASGRRTARPHRPGRSPGPQAPPESHDAPNGRDPDLPRPPGRCSPKPERCTQSHPENRTPTAPHHSPPPPSCTTPPSPPPCCSHPDRPHRPRSARTSEPQSTPGRTAPKLPTARPTPSGSPPPSHTDPPDARRPPARPPAAAPPPTTPYTPGRRQRDMTAAELASSFHGRSPSPRRSAGGARGVPFLAPHY